MNETLRHHPSLNLTFNHYAPEIPWQMMAPDKDTNCYAYALNLPESRRASPGTLLSLDGSILSDCSTTKSGTVKNIKQDGLEEITAIEALSGRFQAIACTIRSGGFFDGDFHFLRLDHESGQWSHKPADNPPQALDDKQKVIETPEKAYFYGYRTFCGYFAIPEDGILYTPV